MQMPCPEFTRAWQPVFLPQCRNAKGRGGVLCDNGPGTLLIVSRTGDMFFPGLGSMQTVCLFLLCREIAGLAEKLMNSAEAGLATLGSVKLSACL